MAKYIWEKLIDKGLFHMVKEFSSFQIKINIQGNGKTDKCMEKANFNGQTVVCMRGNTSMERNVVLGNFFSHQLATHMRDTGKTENSQEEEYFLIVIKNK